MVQIVTIVALMMLLLPAWPTPSAAAPRAAPGWIAVFSDSYQMRASPGQTRTIEFPVPARLGTSDRPVTFVWRVYFPVPPPRVVILEQCSGPDRCYPTVMSPTGEGRGTLHSPPRITNKGRAASRPADQVYCLGGALTRTG